MMRRIKKIAVYVALLFSLWILAPMNTYAATGTTYDTQADVIETKFRIYDGKVQYRHWNRTRGYWVEPDWIDA